MNKFNLSEEDWETVKKLADEMLVMFEGLPVWQVIHALEMVYAYLGVTTNVSFQTMMNNVLTHYKHLKKESNEL